MPSRLLFSRRLAFLLLFKSPLAGQDITRNKIWREFVPLVKDTSNRLTAVQAFMLTHQSEAELRVIDENILMDLDICISDFHDMLVKLRQLRRILISGG